MEYRRERVACCKGIYSLRSPRTRSWPGETVISDRPFRILPGSASLTCGPVSLEKLARQHGTPLYVYSGDEIARRVEMFAQAFHPLHPLICYSVKANSALAILRLIDRQS